MTKYIIIFLYIFCLTASSYADSSEPLLTMYLFASSTCPECKELKEEIFPNILASYGDLINYEHIRVDDIETFKLQLLYENRYGIKSSESVKLFIGTKCLAGLEEIKKNLAKVIDEELINGSQTIIPREILAQSSAEQVKKIPQEKFKTFKLPVVALAGLADGVNPCAFVTLVFFISLLSFLNKSKKDILLVGLLFSGSVFFTYMLLGFGAMRAIKIFSVNIRFSRYLTLGTAILALILSAYSFVDFIRYKKSGNPKDIFLKLPHKIRLMINHLISTKMRRKHIVFGAVVLGITISLLESLCTGQMYLPTIMYILQSKVMMAKALLYLGIYNFMFIGPLLVVFSMVYCGVSSKTISGFFSRNLAFSKLFLAGMFLLLGVGLILSIS